MFELPAWHRIDRNIRRFSGWNRWMSMRPSLRSRANRAFSSVERLAVAVPLIRTLTGSSKRVIKGRVWPFSNWNDRSRKSLAMSRLLRDGGLTRAGPNRFICGTGPV